MVKIKMQKPFDLTVALYEPEIPSNVGTIARTCACLDVNLSIIEPCGFVFEDRNFKRSKLDYETDIELIPSLDDFLQIYETNRIILFSPHSNLSLYDIIFKKNDILLFGRESNGVEDFVAKKANLIISIPMSERSRSLNLAMTVAMGAYEAKRQFSRINH